MSSFLKNIFILSSLFFAQSAFSQAAQLDKTLEPLENYWEQVEERAYEDTLNLCAAYRWASSTGLALASAHSYGALPPSEMLDPQDRKNVSLLSSLKAWARLGWEGAAQPFSTVFGLKVNYNEIYHIEMHDLEFWFKSVYAVFLTRSEGFAKAAEECQIPKQALAEAVLLFDSASSLPGHVLAFIAGGVVFGSVIKALLMAVKPLSRFVSLSPVEKTNLKQVGLSMGALGLASLGAAAVDESEKRNLMAQQLSQNIIKDLETERLTGEQVNRFALLNALWRDFESFKDWPPHSPEYQNKNESFSATIKRHISQETLSLMKEDHRTLENKDLNLLGLMYVEVLSSDFLDLIEEHLQE